MSTDKYTSPLSERYASKEMQYIFSPDKKFKTWRKLWIALAEAENELGLKNEQGGPAVTTEQIEELKAHASRIIFTIRALVVPRTIESSIIITRLPFTTSRSAFSFTITLLSLADCFGLIKVRPT